MIPKGPKGFNFTDVYLINFIKGWMKKKVKELEQDA